MNTKLLNFIVDHMPDELIYWILIKATAYATTGKYSSTVVPELTAMELILRWQMRNVYKK